MMSLFFILCLASCLAGCAVGKPKASEKPAVNIDPHLARSAFVAETAAVPDPTNQFSFNIDVGVPHVSFVWMTLAAFRFDIDTNRVAGLYLENSINFHDWTRRAEKLTTNDGQAGWFMEYPAGSLPPMQFYRVGGQVL